MGGLGFLKLTPNEFLRIAENLEVQEVILGEILKLLSNGDFKKPQEIYGGMKNAKDMLGGS